jgi:hypothetical protein
MSEVRFGREFRNAPTGKLPRKRCAHQLALDRTLAPLRQARIGRRAQVGKDHRTRLAAKVFDMQNKPRAMKFLAVKHLAAQRSRAVPNGETQHGVANWFDVKLPRPNRKRNLARFKERRLLAGGEKALDGQPDLIR